MLFVAQLWKFNGERLKSKNGVWTYMEEKWILPNEKKNSKMELTKLFRDAMVNFRQAKQPYQDPCCNRIDAAAFYFSKSRQDSFLDSLTTRGSLATYEEAVKHEGQAIRCKDVAEGHLNAYSESEGMHSNL